MKILVVDDEYALLEQTKTFLEKKGWEVDTALSAEKGMEMLEDGGYDAVISDYRMPEMNGLEFLRLFKREGNEIPFVMFTGKGREEVAMEALNLGANSYLQKGGDPRTVYGLLAQTVEQEVEHHRTRIRTKESEKRHRAVFENTGTATMIVEEEGIISMVNRRFEDLVGLSKEEIQGKRKWVDFLSCDMPSDGSSRFECKLGDEKDLLVDIAPIPDSGRCVVSLTDITKRKKMEEELKRLNEQYEILANEMDDAIFLYRPDGEVLFINETVVEKFGYSANGLNMKEVNSPEYRSTFDKRVDDILEMGRMYYECVYATAGGSEIPVEVNTTLVEYEGDLALLSVARDISRRKKREERVDFLHSLLRHDLRNKAQIIMGYLNLITYHGGVTDEQEDFINKAMKGVKEQIDLVEKVRTLLKVDDIETEKYDLGSAVKRAVEQLSSSAEEKDVKIDMDNIKCEVRGGDLLEEAVCNLVHNCLQHAECRRIEIIGRRLDGNCELMVEDDGKGIPEDIKDQVFDPGVKRGPDAGTGLGLYLVKTIVESYGGGIRLEKVEKGTRLVISLDRA